jgi:hypothetical protein
MIKLTWRDKELCYREFQQLDRECKEQYLTFLQNLPKNDLSYNDQHILQLYGKMEPVVCNNFLKL